MPVANPIAPIQAYVEAYAVGDKDRIGSLFTEDAVVIFNNMAPQVGQTAIRDSHVQAGRFGYVIEREFKVNDSVVVYEGQMYGVKDGKFVESVPIAFSWTVELAPGGEKIKEWRKYYDGKRVAMAMEALKD